MGGREKADELAGEVIHPQDFKKPVSDVKGMTPLKDIVKAPLFHLASSQSIISTFADRLNRMQSGNPDLTYNDLLKTIASAIGTTHEYHDLFTSTAARVRNFCVQTLD